MHDSLDVTTIIFALLAVFVVWKLKSVLGTRVDIEKPPSRSTGGANTDNVVRLPGAADRPPPPPRQDQRADAFVRTDKGRLAVDAIAAADRTFEPGRFVNGAKMAYQMIIAAFASGDRKTLDSLLSPDVLASFTSAIGQREAAGEQSSTKVVSVDAVEIVDGGVKDGTAQVSTRISAKMINVVRDRNGNVVSGDPETVVSTDDLWTFARVIASGDPTWRLIATETEHHS